MSELIRQSELSFARKYWAKGLPGQLAMGLCGIIAILVALKTMTYEPGVTAAIPYQDHLFRVLSFAALTVWTTFAIGLRRRGPAAIITLGFAIFIELIFAPLNQTASMTLVSTNFGIVLAYCGLQLYWLDLVKQRMQK
jgi:FtsH-binding integral membrane protein